MYCDLESTNDSESVIYRVMEGQNEKNPKQRLYGKRGSNDGRKKKKTGKLTPDGEKRKLAKQKNRKESRQFKVQRSQPNKFDEDINQGLEKRSRTSSDSQKRKMTKKTTELPAIFDIMNGLKTTTISDDITCGPFDVVDGAHNRNIMEYIIPQVKEKCKRAHSVEQMLSTRKSIDEHLQFSQNSQKVKSRRLSQFPYKCKDGRWRQKRKRDKDQPSPEIRDSLRNLWAEIFIFDQSNGEQIRQGTNFHLASYEEYFKNLRFDDKTPFTQYQKLLKWKDKPLKERINSILCSKWGRCLDLNHNMFDEIMENGSSDDTDDERESLCSFQSNLSHESSRRTDDGSAYDTDSFDFGEVNLSSVLYPYRYSVDSGSYTLFPDAPINHMYQIQLHLIWIEKLWEEIFAFRSLFPTISIANVASEDELLNQHEDQLTVWYNSASAMLNLLECFMVRLSIIKLRSVGSLNIEDSRNNESLLFGGTSVVFKEALKDDIIRTHFGREPSVFSEGFLEDTCIEWISNSVKNRCLDSPEVKFKSKKRTEATRESSKKILCRGPYNSLNRCVLSKILPIILKVYHVLTNDQSYYGENKSPQNFMRSLGNIFSTKIGDADWLKRNLDEIHVRLSPLNEDGKIVMPDCCPKLDVLYEFLLSILLRVPLALAAHVKAKFSRIQEGSNQNDHINFIAEIRPVLEELKLSLFCVECLDLQSKESDIIKNILPKARAEFKHLLDIYVSKILVPDERHLQSAKFDRSNYLNRLNRGAFLPSEACSIGSVLRYEYNNLLHICSSSHMIRNSFLCFKFGNVVCNLLSAIITWFECRIIQDQNEHSNRFRKITETTDIANPLISPIDKQVSFSSLFDREVFRDKKQQELLQSMLVGLRTKKSTYIDEEAIRVFQFCCEIRQHIERAIGYRFKPKVDNSNFFEYIINNNFVKIECNSKEYIIFCHQEAISDFKQKKSEFLASAFNLLQNVETCTQIKPRDIVESNQSSSQMSDMSVETPLNTSGPLFLDGEVYDVVDGQKSTQSQSTTISVETELSQTLTTQPFDRQDSSTTNHVLFIIRNSSLKQWHGPIFELQTSDNLECDISMPKEMDIFLLTSHLGNEKLLTQEYNDKIDLVIKQIAVNGQAQEIIGKIRQKCLEVPVKLLDVAQQQLRVFKECQNYILDAQERFGDLYPKLHIENLDYLEREYPDIIRRIFRSFSKYCMELRKLSPKPFASRYCMENSFFKQFSITCVLIFYKWTMFELDTSSDGGVFDLTKKHKKDLYKYVRQVAHFQKEFLDANFLEKLDDFADEPFYSKMITWSNLRPSDLMNNFLTKIEGVVLEKDDVYHRFHTKNTNQNNVDQITPSDQMSKPTLRFNERAKKQVQELDDRLRLRLKGDKRVGSIREVNNSPGNHPERTVEGHTVDFQYELRKLIGQGTFGTVYTAVHTSEGAIETVAVKRIKTDHEGVVEQIEGELAANQSLVHDNIVRYFGLQMNERYVDLVFEFCETDLKEECKEGLEPKLITQFSRQIIDAVSYIHDNGWVHRDIKPQNIFLKSNDRGNLVVKLGDFGSAHYIVEEATTDTTGARGSKGVTIIYSAPEIHQGKPYGRKSDVWSIGCTIFHMITGRVPWSNRTRPLGESAAVIFEMSKGHNPLTFFGQLEPFIDDPNFTIYAKSFLEECFRTEDLRPDLQKLKRDEFLDIIATLDDVYF